MELFADLAFMSVNKWGEELCGDRIEAKRDGDKTIIACSDGLLSGVKANILATLTTKIGITMLLEGLPIEETVKTIASTLPVCRVTNLAYSTFTLFRIDGDGSFQVVEFDNPPMIYIRDGKIFKMPYKNIDIEGKNIRVYEFKAEEGDIAAVVSDGIAINDNVNFCFSLDDVSQYIERMSRLEKSPLNLCKDMIDLVLRFSGERAGDDASIMVVKMRKPSFGTVFTGPPREDKDDGEIVKRFMERNGKKIICGGTTSNIVARELNKTVSTVLSHFDNVPPMSKIDGIDLTLEGAITLGVAAEKIRSLIENPDREILLGDDGASQLARMLVEDLTHIHFIAGRASNEAYKDFDKFNYKSPRLYALGELANLLKRIGKIVTIEYC